MGCLRWPECWVQQQHALQLPTWSNSMAMAPWCGWLLCQTPFHPTHNPNQPGGRSPVLQRYNSQVLWPAVVERQDVHGSPVGGARVKLC